MTAAVSEPAQRAERIELILSQLDSLPTLPTVAARLLERITAADSSAREVIRLIESDQSLTAKVLAMARKAGSGIGAAATVEKVVLLMGFDAVQNAVLSIKIFETLAGRDDKSPRQFDRAEFWKHSLGVACAARLAAEQLRSSVDPERAFVCGLLHDLGKVALDAALPKSYDRVIRRVDAVRGCIADVERELLGVDHTAAGHRLAQRWGLPPWLCECIWLHHHAPSALPASAEHPVEIRLVHFADRLVRELRIGYSGNYPREADAAGLAREMGLDTAAYDRVVKALASHIEERANWIGLDRLTSHELYTKALADANEELGRANAALAESNRRLTLRSRYFEALAEMNRRLSRGLGHAEVCMAAAGAIRSVAEAPGCVVFFRSRSTGLVHVGIDVQGHEPRCVAWEGSRIERPAGLVVPSDGSVALTGVPAATVAPELAARAADEAGMALEWLCPLLSAGPVFAGALLPAGSETGRWAGEPNESGALVQAVRLWMVNVESQHAAQRMNHDLAGINRRLQEAQREAARARSLSMIAEMAAGAAHELNNPLAVISGRAQMLAASPPDEETGRIAALLAEQARRCSQIVAELMEFAKPSPPQKRSTPVGELLGQLRDRWLDRGALPPAAFLLDLSDELPRIQVDPAQVGSAFDELVRNSIEASEGRSPRLVVNCQWDRADETVVIRLEDNGAGMDPETLERAMDPFFSHRPAGRGRGLGLSRAVRWIEINGGRLRLDSRPGEGCTAIVEFPVELAQDAGGAG